MKRTNVPKKERILAEESALDRLLRILYWYPDVELSLSELAQKADVAKSTASRLVDELEKVDFVKIEDKKIIFRIKANTENPQFIKRKIAFNLAIIYHTNLVEFLSEAVQNAQAIVLFGSYRTGEDVSTSDIDIAIETTDDKEMQTIRPEGLKDYEKILHRKIQVHVFNRKYIDINVFNSIANGIVLQGFLEVKK